MSDLMNRIEIRQNPTTAKRVIISTERSKRPEDFLKEFIAKKREDVICSFCEGNESLTPPAVWSWNSNGGNERLNGPGWKVRIVSNKFPYLKIEGEREFKENEKSEDDIFYKRWRGVGASEVIIDSPDKDHKRFEGLSIEQMAKVFFGIRERMIDLERDPRFHYMHLFKNEGPLAGASLDHPHWQLVALSFIPENLMTEYRETHYQYQNRDSCIYCLMSEFEKNSERFIYNNNDFISFTAWAARFPFETIILPFKHVDHFKKESDSRLENLAEIFKITLLKMDESLKDFDYNIYLHLSPVDEIKRNIKESDKFTYDLTKSYHYHFKITPRITKIAGLELGTGVYINPVIPEVAGKIFRETNIDEKIKRY